MKILAIETSCDETGAAVVQKSPKDTYARLISNSLASSLTLHTKTGGVIPEVAAREQLKYILPVIDTTLKKAGLSFTKTTPPEIDAIAVTYGPGLIGSLLVGVETAKTLYYVWNKPLIPVNHLYGHIYANFISENEQTKMIKQSIIFPALALVVSGGHTDLVIMNNHGKLNWIGGTRDDAAGEAFDKIGRLIGLTAYPAGPAIEKAAQKGTTKRFHFPRPMLHSTDFDFSFSGLKTAVLYEVRKLGKLDDQTVADISLETENAIVDILVTKTLKAAEKYQVKSILLGGGVAANIKLQSSLSSKISALKSDISLHIPSKSLCTDNAAMIGAAAFYNNKEVSWRDLAANPQLYFD
jgi:N6-L-threonylcarbamoyladenine synthase